jgi:hypothetical protein
VYQHFNHSNENRKKSDIMEAPLMTKERKSSFGMDEKEDEDDPKKKKKIYRQEADVPSGMDKNHGYGTYDCKLARNKRTTGTIWGRGGASTNLQRPPY